MKVLWFSLSPCGSIRRYNTERVIQGWMISLEDEMKRIPEIELEVAFFSECKETPFKYDGVSYYPMGPDKVPSSWDRLYNRYRSESKKDSIKLRWMLEVINKSNPDLIHIHGTEDAFGLIADYVKNIPVVFSIQGLIAPCTKKFFSGISKNVVRKNTTLRQKLHNVTISRLYGSFKHGSKREIHYLTNARYILGRTFWDKYCTLALNPLRKYYQVNEILRDAFYCRQWKGNVDTYGEIAIVSTISGMIYKGLDTILETSNLLKSYSDYNFKWYVVGLKPDNHYIRLAEQETCIKSEDVNVIYVGMMGADQLADLLSQSDIYVHPSHIENSPNSVCEAMLLGMPVIATNVGGTSSIVKNGEEGILVQDGDPYIMAGAIIDTVQHPELIIEMGKAAKRTALVRHDKNKIINELLTTYKQIIKDFNCKSRIVHN